MEIPVVAPSRYAGRRPAQVESNGRDDASADFVGRQAGGGVLMPMLPQWQPHEPEPHPPVCFAGAVRAVSRSRPRSASSDR